VEGRHRGKAAELCQLGPVKDQLRRGEDVVPLSNLPHTET